jgi:uncharacterized protein YkwD
MRRIIFGFALLLLASCAGLPAAPPPQASPAAAVPVVPPPPPLPPAPPSTEQLAQIQQRLYARVAEERMRLDAEAKSLKIDPELAAAAQAHSDDMAKKRAFDSSNDPNENIAVQHLMTNPNFQGYVGENSAMQYFTPGAAIDPDEMARVFLELWLKSPEHRRHIAFPGFDRTGVGIAANDNEIYASQIFSTDLGLPPPPPPPPAPVP